MKVLLAVDGSDDTKKMLAYLATHEDILGKKPELFVLNVQVKVPPRVAKHVGKAVLNDYYRHNAEAVLAPISKFLTRHDADFDTLQYFGAPAEGILKISEEKNVDLIVMGSRGHTSMKAMLLGSVAQKVLSESKVPVLLIR
jgi:nucleotide-binding universal stress UspA family protein